GAVLRQTQAAFSTVRVWVATAPPELSVIWKVAGAIGVKENCAPVPVKSSNGDRASHASAHVPAAPAAGRSPDANDHQARTSRAPDRHLRRRPRCQINASSSAASSHRYAPLPGTVAALQQVPVRVSVVPSTTCAGAP